MLLTLPANELHDEEQILELNKINTLIGRNGAGKSAIMNSIFSAKLEAKEDYKEHQLICFSSGQNESYSKNFNQHLKRARKDPNDQLNLDCFYYNHSWSSLIIFLATSCKSTGLTRKFLIKHDYIEENDLDEDRSTHLSVEFKVDSAYTDQIQRLRSSANESFDNEILNSSYLRTLTHFIHHFIPEGENYDFEKPITRQKIILNQETLAHVSFDEDESTFIPQVNFFTQAASNNYFISLENAQLSFKKSNKTLNLNDLSDGEYQLLFLYALIDIFDHENTIFLLDEADSHLHYKNIHHLWSTFKGLKGKVITTTHLIDSITQSGLDNLYLVDKGKIQKEISYQYLINRLQDLSEAGKVQYEALSMLKKIVIIDDPNDWEIFKLLVIRKISQPDEDTKKIERRLNKFGVVKQNSGYDGNTNNDFAKPKIDYTNSLYQYLKEVGKLGHLENIFLLCDKDDLHIKNIGVGDNKYLYKENKNIFKQRDLKIEILIWKRREIKHYLLSLTALGEDINDSLNLGLKSELKRNNNGDLDSDGQRNDQVAEIKSVIVKEILDDDINIKGSGFCIDKTKQFIETIPPDEISDDISNMYYILVGNND